MNKIRILMAVFMVAGAAVVFASGTQENNVPPTATGEELTLTGKIRLQANDFPIITTSKGDYELMYPRMYANQVQVKEGDTVTVTGYTVPGPRWETNATAKYLAVTRATIAGKEFVLPRNGYGSGMMHDGYGPGMMGGRGMMNDRGGRGGRW